MSGVAETRWMARIFRGDGCGRGWWVIGRWDPVESESCRRTRKQVSFDDDTETLP